MHPQNDHIGFFKNRRRRQNHPAQAGTLGPVGVMDHAENIRTGKALAEACLIRDGQGRIHAVDIDELELALLYQIGNGHLFNRLMPNVCQVLSGYQAGINEKGLGVAVGKAPVLPQQGRDE